MTFPCVHTAIGTVDMEIPVPVKLTFPEGLAGIIEETPYEGAWASEVNARASHHLELPGEVDREGSSDDDGPEMHFIREVRQEMTTLGKGAEFRYTLTEMLYKLGRLRGRLETQFADTLEERELQMRVRSEFLVQCLTVVMNGTPWK
jgi:hypothetical protein